MDKGIQRAGQTPDTLPLSLATRPSVHQSAEGHYKNQEEEIKYRSGRYVQSTQRLDSTLLVWVAI